MFALLTVHTVRLTLRVRWSLWIRRIRLEQELAGLQQALENAGRPPPGGGGTPVTDKCIICGCVITLCLRPL